MIPDSNVSQRIPIWSNMIPSTTRRHLEDQFCLVLRRKFSRTRSAHLGYTTWYTQESYIITHRHTWYIMIHHDICKSPISCTNIMQHPNTERRREGCCYDVGNLHCGKEWARTGKDGKGSESEAERRADWVSPWRHFAYAGNIANTAIFATHVLHVDKTEHHVDIVSWRQVFICMSGRHKRNEMSSIDILYVGGKYEANEMTCEDAVAHVLEMRCIPVTPLIQRAFDICAEEIKYEHGL